MNCILPDLLRPVFCSYPICLNTIHTNKNYVSLIKSLLCYSIIKPFTNKKSLHEKIIFYPI
jgi:hypothetical protein